MGDVLSQDGPRRAIGVGASSGMGVAVVARLTGNGHQVAGLDLPTADWTEESVAHHRIPVDIYDSGSVDLAIRDAVDRPGGLLLALHHPGHLYGEQRRLMAGHSTDHRRLCHLRDRRGHRQGNTPGPAVRAGQPRCV